MNKTGIRKRKPPQKQASSECTNKTFLTSRDVYYFVANEQESVNNLDKHDGVSSQLLDNLLHSTEKYLKGVDELDQKQLYYYSIEQNVELANDVPGYLNDGIEDERDCELLSVMTYHSDIMTDSLGDSTPDSYEKRKSKDLSLQEKDSPTKIDKVMTTEMNRYSSSKESADSSTEEEGQLERLKPQIDNRSSLVSNHDNSSEEIRRYFLKEELMFKPEKESKDSKLKQEERQSPFDPYQHKATKGVRKSSKTVLGTGCPKKRQFVLLTAKGDPKKQKKQEEMEKVVKELLIRGENKIKELRTHAHNLRQDSEVLREENKALRKLQRLQGKEVADMDRFVHMTTTTARDIRKNVRDAEVSCFSIDTSLRNKNKEIRQLRRECERYEKLIDMDKKMPGQSELEGRLGRAERYLQDKNKEIEILNKKVKLQEKKALQVRQKQNRQFAQLDDEVQGTIQECDKLKQRLKEAERQINISNIYIRRTTTQKALASPTALAALTWHPPDQRQTANSKVKKWLDDSKNKY